MNEATSCSHCRDCTEIYREELMHHALPSNGIARNVNLNKSMANELEYSLDITSTPV